MIVSLDELRELLAAGVEWRLRANCRGVNPDVMYPENARELPRALAVCRACDVVTACGEYALSAGESFGVWGAMTARERKRVTAERLRNGG